jgi:hypothetical protein
MYGWEEDITKKGVEEYIKFLYICGSARDIHYSPSGMVDLVWHQHLLNPVEYYDYCMNTFGFVVPHYPENGMKNSDRDAQKTRYTLTFKKYKELFEREPDPFFWETLFL